MKQKKRLWVSSENYWGRELEKSVSPRVLCGHATISNDVKVKFCLGRNDKSRIFRSLPRVSAHSSSCRKETYKENCNCSYLCSLPAGSTVSTAKARLPQATNAKFCCEQLGLIPTTFRLQKNHSVSEETFPREPFVAIYRLSP